MRQCYCYQSEVDYLTKTAHAEMIYSSYPCAIFQPQLQNLIQGFCNISNRQIFLFCIVKDSLKHTHSLAVKVCIVLRPACVCRSHRICHAPCFQVWSLWASCHWGPLCEINGRQRRAKKSGQLPLSPPERGATHSTSSTNLYSATLNISVFLLIWFCCQQALCNHFIIIIISNQFYLLVSMAPPPPHTL